MATGSIAELKTAIHESIERKGDDDVKTHPQVWEVYQRLTTDELAELEAEPSQEELRVVARAIHMNERRQESVDEILTERLRSVDVEYLSEE